MADILLTLKAVKILKRKTTKAAMHNNANNSNCKIAQRGALATEAAAAAHRRHDAADDLSQESRPQAP